MDRNREARRGVTMAASNGLSRRRHRSNCLRDTAEEDGMLEFQETARLRDRKKDRDRDRDRDRDCERERDRDRDRERDRERERDRLSRSSKRRRSDKFIHGSMREDGGDDTSEESVNDDEDDDDDDGGGGGGNSSSLRMLPPNPSTSSSSMLNHHNNNHHHNSNNHNSNSNINNNQSRKSFPPPAKVFKVTPPSVTTSTTTATASTWKAADEMMGVSVPRKARSASTKRSHERTSSGGPGTGGDGGGEQIHRQASISPVRPSVPTVMATPALASPCNVSVRKKMKPSGPKLRPPKSSSNKSTSSAQDEIEIEIAEVLYGMMRQPQGPSKQEIVAADSVSREISNNNNIKFSSDAKSRVSSPISNAPSTLPQSSSILPTNSSYSTATMSTIASKRKRPLPVKYDDENPSMFTLGNSPISATTKTEMDQYDKNDPSSNLEKNSATAAMENGTISYELGSSKSSEPQLESKKLEINALLADSKGLAEELESGRRDLCAAKEEPQSPKKESTADLRLDNDHRDNMGVTAANSTPSEIQIQREERFQIDLMAPPLRSSPERDGEIDFVAVDLQSVQKPEVKEDEKEVKTVKDDDTSVEAEEKKKAKTVTEESESQKPVVGKERNIDLQLDLEKSERYSGSGSLTGNKLHQHAQKQQQQQQQPSVPEKTAQSNSLPPPLSMASWPGGLPPMGYMTPLHGVVSMDGSAVSSAALQPPHFLFSQPRPKRCATHSYIARNIHYLQQFMKMNPFWPAAAGSPSLYGAKAACNLNVVPPTELHGTFPGRGVNTVPDKGQGLAIFPSHTGKDGKSSQPATIMDAAAQRKQVLLQQALPPGAPSNILHAPAFIFPLSHQQAAAAAAVRPGSVKSSPAASFSASNSATVSATATAGAAATAMSFNYPNMPGNETQYLAILQNNGYPFPISANIGAPPAYRGTHSQAMPFFNGSFYPSQMLHPSQLQQQQQQQHQLLHSQSQQSQQGHQNTSISSGSSSSQKHLQNQQQRPRSNGLNGSSGTLQGFPTPKNQPQLQRQQQQNQQVPHQSRQPESEMGGKESPSTADSRVSRANVNIYGQNFAMPLHPPNFALMTTASMGGATSTSEKKPQQQQSSKAGVESLAPTFAMTFSSINGAATGPGFDISSIAQNPALLQSLPEAVRHGYQIMADAQAAQQKKNYRVSEEGKTGGKDASNAEEERKSMSGKPPATVGLSIASSRQDLTDAQVSAMTGNTVLDSSTQTLNLGSVPARTNVSVMHASMSNANASAQQHQQMMQLQKQQQFAATAAATHRSKTPATSNGSVYSDHMPASSMAGKFPNVLSVFPQNVVQSSSSAAQSQQWKNSGRTSTSQVNSQSLASSTTSSLKNLPQQQGRTQQGHTQISFAANPKSSSALGQPPPSNNQSASPPMMVGSPTSSISKTSAGGSPRTTAATSTTGNKGGQTSLSSQQAKNSPSMPSRKSSPVPSILGNPNISSSSSIGAKQQMSQQLQQQFSKHALHQAHQLFSNAALPAYMQAQAQHAASATSSASGFFNQRHCEQQTQQQPGSSTASSSGMLSLCPSVTRSNSGTSDPAKAVAAASNIKGLSSQGLVHTGQFATKSSGKQHQLVPPGFPYVYAVPTPVQVKPAEQKQPAGE